jgi:PAS domain S-box-containing protein
MEAQVTAESNPPHALAERDGRALLEAMPDSLFVLSREGICLDYHAAKSDVRPAPPEQFLGRAVRDMLPGQIAERLEASLARVLQTGNSETLEYPLTAAGETRYYEARVVLYDCEQVLVIARDITQRKQVEADLRAQEQLFEHLVAVARATAERPMLADTLQNALDIAMALTGATDGNLILLDSVGQITHNILPSSLASPAERENQVAFIMDKGLAGWVAEHHEAALIVDTLADERRLTLPDARSHFRSALSAPILSGPTLMGVLTLAHTQPGHFSQQHLRLIKAASDEITLAVRNAEMFEEQRHMAERQITLYQVLRTVSGLPDSNQVAQLAVDAIVRFAGWSQAALIIPSEDNTQWVIRAASGYLAPALGMARPIEQGIVGRALRTGRTQVVPDVRADPDYVAGHERTRSEVIVPLQRSNHTLGALSLNSDRVAGFDSDDLVLAESLADAIALALDSARLYEQMQQRAADMSALYAITRTTSRSLAIEEVLEQALSSALSLLGFNAGLIALVESEGSGQRHVSSDNLRLAAARGLPAELVEHFQRGGLQDTLTAYVYQSRESLVIQDSQREMSPEIARFADHLLGHGYRAFAGIPLLHQGQALGAMSLVAREPRSSSVYDTALLGTLGQQIAGAVANAKLFQATLAGRSRLQALINASRDGILLLGMDGRILILNAPALKLLRLPGEAPEWLGRELKDVLALLRVPFTGYACQS